MKRITLILVFLVCLPIVLMGQSVTVGSSGDYASIGAAITAVEGNSSGPDVITILDAGPFLEGRLLLSGDASESDLTIEASAGIRPVVAVEYTGDGALAIIRNGTVTVKDLILIPQEGDATTRPYAAVLVDDPSSPTGFTVTLQNLLICPNDGSNQPAAALDGSSVTGASATFRDEGVLCNSTNTSGGPIYKVYLYDVIVCGLTGEDLSDGIRGFIDGNPGSEWIVGEGCVMSFNNRAGFQPGGNNDGIVIKVQGTESKPVKIFGNDLHGISTSNTVALGGGLSEVTWCLSAGSVNGAGFHSIDDSTPTVTFSNCTFAGNSLGAFDATDSFSGTYTATGNCIFAGNGVADSTTNVIDVSTTDVGTMSITDSAVVLAGSFQLDTTNFDLDGLDDNDPSNVTKTNVISADPQFLSIDPTNPGFFKVGSLSYATAGPGGGSLGGAMGYEFPTEASYDCWSLYK